MPPPGEARADWRIVADVGRAMGYGDAFGWHTPAQVFREWARLTAYENKGERFLNLGPLVGITPEAYEALEPIQWPVTPQGGTPRLFTDGRFQTPDGRARMQAVAARGPAEATDPFYPFALNTGRIRDQWHTMTRTALAPELCRHAPEPYVEVHPDDAEAAGLKEGALARVQTRQGEAVALARVSDRQRPGSVFMPLHWSEAFAPSGRANPLVAAKVDPRSGQPEFKHTPARLSAYRETWRGFFLAREPWRTPAGLDLVWRRIPQVHGHLHEFAGRGDESERAALKKALTRAAGADVLRYEDPASGSLREAYIAGDALDRVLFLTEAGRLPPREWLAELLGAEALTPSDRAALLIGRPPGAPFDSSPIVCACRGVRASRIDAALTSGCASVDAVGEATGAGTSCGSCRPEIARRLAADPPKEIRDAA
jgi:assimilatory nitrate reductase catalytic subunit